MTHFKNNKQENIEISFSNQALRVGIIGGGIAGSTIAIRLAALGVQTYLFESKSSLIDGPPMCHLHAGGNLYREIPDEDCIQLLKQSIDMLRLYPYSIDVRPTIITVPTRDKGHPNDLIPRLDLLTRVYKEMVDVCPANKVLGEPESYYQLYDRETFESLAKQAVKIGNSESYSTDDWVANAAKTIDLDQIKYPVIAVKEYGWNIFRLAASAQEALQDYANAHVMVNTQVTDVQTISSPIKDNYSSDNNNTNHSIDEKGSNVNDAKTSQQLAQLSQSTQSSQWQIHYHSMNKEGMLNNINAYKEYPTDESCIEVDYLINACGFRTGVIDNMVGIPAKRMVEFKASYIAHWTDLAHNLESNLTHDSKDDLKVKNTNEESDDLSNNLQSFLLPEIIFHGERGTPQGMVQLTPYPNGYFQIHSMDKEVTLFKDGLVMTANGDAQPQLNPSYLGYIDKGWDKALLNERSQRAIEQVSSFVPQFASAKPTGNALYGGQQIPGVNDTLRVADIRVYSDINYARAENVKASSALLAADDVVSELENKGLLAINNNDKQKRLHHKWAYLDRITKSDIDRQSEILAEQRQFPIAMSGIVTPYA